MEISDDILALQNCAIYYIGKEAETEYDEELFLSYLAEMRLVVMPVSTNLLTRPSRAIDVVYKFTQEGNRHIPVLTLMQEEQLDELYTRVFGDLQYLNKHMRDNTAIPFEKKLADYLMSVLIGNKLAEKIRKSFDAYIFLSYRKKDRVYAQELMRLVHKNDFCRDIAIWYDEFLNPGEGFNGAIKVALEKSDLFALTVTPNLLEDHNYVMDKEYPLMREAGKPILSAEMVGTDRKELERKFDGIPACTDAHNELKLSESLLQALGGITKCENNSNQEHNFMIGLAYLTGIDVEVDVERALRLIIGAAEAGVVKAIEKLVDMYRNGDGVDRDYLIAIEWQKKLTQLLKTRYRESNSESDLILYEYNLWILGNYWRELGRFSQSKSCYEDLLVIAKRMAEETKTLEARRSLSISYQNLGYIAEGEGQLSKAREYYEKSLETSLTLAEETNTVKYRRSLSISYEKLGSIAKGEGQLSKAREYYEKSLEISLTLAEETKTIESRRDLSVIYDRLGDIAKGEGMFAEARGYYEKSLEIGLTLAEETKTVESRRDLSVSYDKFGDIAEREGQLSKARGYYEKSLEISLMLAEETKTVKSRRDLSVSYNRLGDIAKGEGRFAKAREYYEKSLEISLMLAKETKTVESRRNLSVSYNRLGDIAKGEGRFAKAREYYEKSLEISLMLAEETKTVESRRDQLLSYGNLGDIVEIEGQPAKAREYYEKSLSIGLTLAEETKMVESLRDLSVIYDRLGSIAKEEGQLSKAREYYEKSLEISLTLAEETKTVESRRDLSAIYDRLGDIAEREGQLSKARECYEKSLEIRTMLTEETKAVESYDDLAVSYYKLGSIEYLQNKQKDLLRKALTIWKVLMKSCPTVPEYKRRYEIVKKMLDS